MTLEERKKLLLAEYKRRKTAGSYAQRQHAKIQKDAMTLRDKIIAYRDAQKTTRLNERLRGHFARMDAQDEQDARDIAQVERDFEKAKAERAAIDRLVSTFADQDPEPGPAPREVVVDLTASP